MSSNSYTTLCPVCENTMDVCESNRPFPQIDCSCNHCGFSTFTEIDRQTLEEINENRYEWWEELITEDEYNKHNWHEYFSPLRDMK